MQTMAIAITIILAVVGSGMATIGAVREVDEPTTGLVLIVLGTLALGLGGIVVSIAAKLLK